MSDKLRVKCTYKDCAYYSAVPYEPELCDCSHTDKGNYNFQPCPLYRKDWATKSSDANSILDKFRPKKKP